MVDGEKNKYVTHESETESQRQFNDELREIAAEKFSEQYDLDVPIERLVVIERSGFVAIQVSPQESDSES